MKIPLLGIYILTKKSLEKRQLEIEKTTRAKTNKLIAGLLHDAALLNQAIDEIMRGKK